MTWTALGLTALGGFAALSTPAQAAAPEEHPIERASPRPPQAPNRVQPTPIPVSPAARPISFASPVDPAKAQADRQQRISAVKSWGYQLVGVNLAEAQVSPFDLLIVDATAGLKGDRGFKPEDVQRLKKKADGSRRLLIAYLPIGEADEYRSEVFSAEYLGEDVPEWLGAESDKWKGNRLVNFCHEGWQRTIIGDDQGRSLYNSIDPSPLTRLIELGFDGILLDRLNAYVEVRKDPELRKDCAESDKKMVEFVARIADHARRHSPGFLVVTQNAEELVRHKRLVEVIDALVKEDLFYSAEPGQKLNPDATIRTSLAHLKAVKAAGRPVLVIDYVQETSKKADAKKRIQDQGFLPYIGPRNLGHMWLPGLNF